MTTEEDKKVFANNLKQHLAMKGMRQIDLAKAIGVPQQTISNWCNAVSMPKNFPLLDAACAVLGCERDDLTSPPSATALRKVIKAPIYGRVAAGVPLEAIQDISGYEELDPNKFDPSFEYFALPIHGNSMEPRMREGDIVIVRKQSCAESGDTVIVLVNGNEATCKRFRKLHDGIELVSTNPSYGPMFYSAEQITSLPVTILGKVVELRAKY